MSNKELKPKKKMLLHSCCGPCSTYVISALLKDYDITVFFYNPNFDTSQEYERRIIAQKKVIDEINNNAINFIGNYSDLNKDFEIYKKFSELKNDTQNAEIIELQQVKFIDGLYEPSIYLNAIKGLEKEKEGGKRCEECFRLRLTESVKVAKEKGFDIFTTTLSVSPYKNSKLINKIGSEISKEYGIEYLESNFKKKNGYLISTKMSDELELYRQNYCGCAFAKEHLK